MSKTFVDSLLSWNDPRLSVYAQLNKDTIIANRTYQGLPNGLNDGAGPALFYISRIGAYWRETPAAPLALLTYSEVLFLEAEAAERGWITGTPPAATPVRLPKWDDEAVLNKATLDAGVAAQLSTSSTELTSPLGFPGR